jgi:hypothetical protein
VASAQQACLSGKVSGFVSLTIVIAFHFEQEIAKPNDTVSFSSPQTMAQGQEVKTRTEPHVEIQVSYSFFFFFVFFFLFIPKKKKFMCTCVTLSNIYSIRMIKTDWFSYLINVMN